MLGHGKNCFGLRQGSEIDPSSWPYTCFCLMDMLAWHQALSFRLFLLLFSNFEVSNFFEFFWFFWNLHRKTKISKNFWYFQVATVRKFATKKKMLLSLQGFQRHNALILYSSLSEEWLQANQVEHIDCLTQILEYSIQFLSSHTHIPPLSPRTPKHNSPIASGSVVNRLVEQGY
jgi:hypothetical protein